MPLILHCKNCHHEWPSFDKEAKCNWCGGDSYILTEEKTWDYKKVLKILKKIILQEN